MSFSPEFEESDYLPADNSSKRVSAPTHELLTRPANPPKAAPLCMGRAMRVVVVGGRRVGKTAILRQVACFEDITSKVDEFSCFLSIYNN
ncbi:hypothetical protein ANCDUO_20363 [Ancylostoma duodenale]|uniref:Ras family protein n=1 Tax=Ancylostoma duodenale TaxID=51022 RepID=A0A0C2CIE3_9BILA|nr:hypothetical protein ANCDUO_20363 [Ancylostoma duodenale]